MPLDKKYLKLLSEKYPNELSVSTKIVPSVQLNLNKEGAEILSVMYMESMKPSNM